MKEQGSITMKDIARNLGVSIATVSRALQDCPRISARQRARIQIYAREHNFYPNIIGAALRNIAVLMPMKIIGVIVPAVQSLLFFASILSGIEEEASARGYRIMVCPERGHAMPREVQICDSFYKDKVCGSHCISGERYGQSMTIFRN
jgi:DNA-binding LacI/PurR family transcriptional regulator